MFLRLGNIPPYAYSSFHLAILLLINKYLGCFHILSAVNNAAMRMSVQISLGDLAYNSFGYVLMVFRTCYTKIWHPNILENCRSSKVTDLQPFTPKEAIHEFWFFTKVDLIPKGSYLNSEKRNEETHTEKNLNTSAFLISLSPLLLDYTPICSISTWMSTLLGLSIKIYLFLWFFRFSLLKVPRSSKTYILNKFGWFSFIHLCVLL